MITKSIVDIDPIDESDVECLAEVAAVLAKHGRLERFGVRLAHDNIGLRNDEILVERTDVAGRRQTLSPEPKSIAEERTLETSWMLGPGTRESMTVCDTRCWKNIQGNHERDHV